MTIKKRIGKYTFTLVWNVQGLADFLVGVGLAWLAAWVFNPALTSGTVWFLAALFGLLLAGVQDGPREKK